MRKKRNPKFTEPVTTNVEKFSHDGRGIARIDGKTTFIEGALADETVIFQYTRQKKDYDEGRLLSVVKGSNHRVEPRCPHYSLCGGCSLQHLDGPAQIHEKQALLLDLLERTGHCKPDAVLPPLTSDLWHYRNKARLSVRYVQKKNATLIGFREKLNPRYITEIDQCPVLNARMDAHIRPLRELLDKFQQPESIAQIEVAAGDDDMALIFRHLLPLSPEDQEKLIEFGKAADFRIYLQPAGPDSVHLIHPKDASEFLSYTLPEENITFQFHPNDFTQVNAGINRLMVQQAMVLLALQPDDEVLDLFCGLGNFSLPMAKHCRQVVGIEGSEAMVNRAQMNATANGITNTAFFSANLEEELNIASLKNTTFSKVLLDPPRTGAITMVKNIHKIAPKRLVYVSCNPATLARDADILVNVHGYRLTQAGVMDMFSHTAHVESIALFEV